MNAAVDKHVCIQFALKRELHGFTRSFGSAEKLGGPFPLLRFLRGGIILTLAVSGLGKARAAACAQYCIDRFAPHLVVNAGSSGGVCPSLAAGDIFAAACCVEYDFTGIREKTPVFSVPAAVIKAATAAGIPLAVLGSADRNADTAETKQRLHRLGIAAADWEGAAVVKTCTANGVAVAVLKTVTDVSTDGFETEFAANVVPFCAALAPAAERLIASFYRIRNENIF